MNEEMIKAMAAELTKAFNASKSDSVSKLSHEEKVNLIKSIASDPKAREAYAQSRASVILPLIPEQSTVRSIFRVEELAPNAQPEYPISFDRTVLASYMPKYAGNVVRVLEGDVLYVPTFGIEGAYRYSMDIADQGRLDIARMADEELRSQIVAKEEAAGWSTIKGTFSGVNANQTVYCSGTTEAFHAFSKKAINAMSVQMDIQRRTLTDLYASPRSIADIKEWSNNQIDFTTAREIFVNGGLPGGRIWDIQLHKVYNSSLVPNSEAWGFDTNKFGVMPIRKALKTYEDPTAIQQWQIGVMARELVGFGTTDSYAVVKAVMDSTHLGTSCSTF